MALILKAFGGKLPTLTNRDVEELSAELGRTASSIRSEFEILSMHISSEHSSLAL